MFRMRFTLTAVCLVALTVLFSCRGASAQVAELEPPADAVPSPVPPPADDPATSEEIDVLTRGPVHEAFVEQNGPDPKAGLIVSKAPPEPVNEVPPEVKPEGDDVVWIPGYWFWDDERSDYLWVSGLWRRIPPGRRWVPGYWQEAAGRYQWVSGFWGPVSAPELEYLDTPPPSLEAGPSSPAASDDDFWVPGNWTYAGGAYRWRPGYWCDFRDGWTWVSARFLWTPRGCIYVPGYWDYSLTRRGCLFAPVYFRSPIYASVGYRYRPACSISFDSMLMHLFVRPDYHHYYFGDYYAPIYRQRHYVPCYSYHARYRGYASLYVYYQHHFGHHGIDYCGRVRDWHHHYVEHPEHRPAHTYKAQRERRAVNRRDENRQNAIVGRYLSGSPERIAGSRPVRVSARERERVRRNTEELRELTGERQFFESAKRATRRQVASRNGRTESRPDRFTLPRSATAPRSPIRARDAVSRAPSPPMARGPASPATKGRAQPSRRGSSARRRRAVSQSPLPADNSAGRNAGRSFFRPRSPAFPDALRRRSPGNSSTGNRRTVVTRPPQASRSAARSAGPARRPARTVHSSPPTSGSGKATGRRSNAGRGSSRSSGTRGK